MTRRPPCQEAPWFEESRARMHRKGQISLSRRAVGHLLRTEEAEDCGTISSDLKADQVRIRRALSSLIRTGIVRCHERGNRYPYRFARRPESRRRGGYRLRIQENDPSRQIFAGADIPVELRMYWTKNLRTGLVDEVGLSCDPAFLSNRRSPKWY